MKTEIWNGHSKREGKMSKKDKGSVALMIPEGCKQVFITEDEDCFREQLDKGGMVSLYDAKSIPGDTTCPKVYIGYRPENITKSPDVQSDQGMPVPLVYTIAE